MAATIPCVPCAATTQSVDIPGSQGIPGTDGSNGIDSFTTTTANFVIPAIGSNVTVSLVDSSWMVTGQNVVFDGPATFEVVSLPGATSATLTFLGYANDLAPGVTINSGAKVGPAGTQPAITALSVYASGTAYSLTSTPALLALGTTTPSLTITSPGTWKLEARVRIDNNAKTTAAVRTITILLRRTNNTAADITDTSCAVKTAIMTTLTFTLTSMNLPTVSYVTLNSDDQIEAWGSADSVAGAGTFDVVEAMIFATKIS